MNHPGVRSLLERFSGDGRKKNASLAESVNNDIILEIDYTKSSNLNVKTVNDCNAKPLFSNVASTSAVPSVSSFSQFKETLRQRMKEKRMQIRKEEEEDELVDEEYHYHPKNGEAAEAEEGEEEEEDDNEVEEDDDNDEKEKEEDSDEKETKIKANESEDSDTDDFKLNLDDDDDEEELNNKIGKKANRNGNNKEATMIPLTNSIPSNQKASIGVTSVSKSASAVSIASEFSDYSAIYDGGVNQKRPSLSEVGNMSFNYGASSSIGGNDTLQNADTVLSSMSNEDEDDNTGENSEIDELAMLCSGQFRPIKEKQQDENEEEEDDEKDGNEKEHSEQEKEQEKEPTKDTAVVTVISEGQTENIATTSNVTTDSVILNNNNDNDDLYAADDGEEYDAIMSRKFAIGIDDENSNSNSKSTKEEELNDKEKEENDTNKDQLDVSISKENDQVFESKSNENDKPIDEEEKEIIFKLKRNKSITNPIEADKNSKKVDDEEKEELSNEGFFEVEAELSGSDADEEDENYEGESGDDDSIVISGDDDELHSHAELKEQLDRIYHKDQLDEHNKELRLFKEMYLPDGEMYKDDKEARRKQFRWKNLNDDWKGNNLSSSDDEDDEEEDENSNEGKKSLLNEPKMNNFKDKGNRFLDSNWRSIRHEREQFVDRKSNINTLLSKDEEDNKTAKKENKKHKRKHKKNDENSSDDEEENSNDGSSLSSSDSALNTCNDLLKKGQQLLKQNMISRTIQQKRLLDTTTNDNTAEVFMTSSINLLTGSSITIKKITTSHTHSSIRNDLQKLSFLNRDNSHLLRYVSKNFSHINSLDSNGSTTVVSKSKTTTSNRNSNMVFTRVDSCEEESNSNHNNINTANTDKQTIATKKMKSSLKSIIESENKATVDDQPVSKRSKLDTETRESIFQYID